MWGADLAMSHAGESVMGMWDPSKRFSEIVTGIENCRKMLPDEFFLLVPFWDDKMLNVNVLSTCHVINEQMCPARRNSIKHCENTAKTFGNLPTSCRQAKLCFS